MGRGGLGDGQSLGKTGEGGPTHDAAALKVPALNDPQHILEHTHLNLPLSGMRRKFELRRLTAHLFGRKRSLGS